MIGDTVNCPICSGSMFNVRKDGMVLCRDCNNMIGKLDERSMQYKPFK
jgi:uncharacterized Zn finger protein (UPF0148 family)